MDVSAEKMVWALLVLAVGAACWTASRWRRTKAPGSLKPFSAMPAPPQTFPFGNLPDLTKGKRLQFHLVLHNWALQLGPVFRYNVLGSWKVVVLDPAVLPAIIGRPGLPKSKMYKKFRELCAWSDDFLFTRLDVHDAHWKSSRKTLARAFSADEIRKKFGATTDAALELATKLSALPPGTAVEAQDAMHRVTMDVTLTAGFGIPSNAVALFGRPVPVLEALHYVYKQSSLRVTNPLVCLYERWLPFLPAARENRRRHFHLYKMYEDMYDQLEAKWPVAEDDNSMWGCLKRIEDPVTGKPLSRAQLVPEMAGIFLGALDTTGQTCAITLGLIAGHPEVQRRLAEELGTRGLLATPANPVPRRPEPEDLAALPYLEAVLRESLRLLPVSAVGMQRATAAPVTDLGGYAVPANTDVLAFVYGLQHSSKYWDAPEAFRPERWLTPAPASKARFNFPATNGKAEDGGAARSNLSNASRSGAEPRATKWMSAAADAQDGRKAAFLPFSGGPMDCLGQRLAMMEAPLILAILLGRFEAELDESMGGVEGMLARQCNTFTIAIDQGLHMKFKPRAGWLPEPAAHQGLRSKE
ncbi:hypothetical protein WJX81_005391 [Elliptochloris bilobata]|uniref:Cytochrome P450 n=1 Tax=Elliptochloris bilobata TaxID=381761 RepID=A0AAW1RIE1_9CHLO